VQKIASLISTVAGVAACVSAIANDVWSEKEQIGLEAHEGVQPLSEVVETLRSKGVVVVLPRELGLDVTARGQGLAGLDDKEVANAGLVGRLVVLGSDHDALTEEVLMDRLAVGLGNKHLGGLFCFAVMFWVGKAQMLVSASKF